MIKEITITVEARDEKNLALHENLIRKELKKNHINTSEFEKVFVKKSIDARHGQLKLHLRYKIYIGEKPESAGEWKPAWKSCSGADEIGQAVSSGHVLQHGPLCAVPESAADPDPESSEGLDAGERADGHPDVGDPVSGNALLIPSREGQEPGCCHNRLYADDESLSDGGRGE